MELLSKCFQRMRVAERPKRGHLLPAQFCSAVSFMDWHRAMAVLVGGVLRSRAPYKVRQTVIDRVPIQVTGLMTVWTGAAKRFKDQAVDGLCMIPTIFSQRDLFVSRSLPRDYSSSAPLKDALSLSPDFTKFVHEVARKSNAMFHHAYDCIMEDQGWQCSFCTG